MKIIDDTVFFCSDDEQLLSKAWKNYCYCLHAFPLRGSIVGVGKLRYRKNLTGFLAILIEGVLDFSIAKTDHSLEDSDKLTFTFLAIVIIFNMRCMC